MKINTTAFKAVFLCLKEMFLMGYRKQVKS